MSEHCALIIENRFDVSKIIESHAKFIPTNWEIIHLRLDIKSMFDYNKALTDPDLWNNFRHKKVLIFQHDSMLLRTGIEEFIEWDYVGAPWKFQEHGGNGGLSWRSRDAMNWCINQKPWDPSLGNEDVYFSNLLKDSPFKLAPREVCEKFSCESIYKEGTLGYHAIEKYLTPEEVIKIKTQYEQN